MNYTDSALELNDYQEDTLAVSDHGFDVESEWYLELDLHSMAVE